MFKFKKSRGFSLYDILISLIIFVLVSVFLTRIFVGNVEVNKNNRVLDACTFEAIETFEQIKSVKNGQTFSTNKYFNSFSKEQNPEEIVYSKVFLIGDVEYTEKVHVKMIEEYESDKIKIATVSDSNVNSELSYDYTTTTLYKVKIKIFDNNNKEVYNIETNFTEAHKVIK